MLHVLLRLQTHRYSKWRYFVPRGDPGHTQGRRAGPVDTYKVVGNSWKHIREVLRANNCGNVRYVAMDTVEKWEATIGTIDSPGRFGTPR